MLRDMPSSAKYTAASGGGRAVYGGSDGHAMDTVMNDRPSSHADDTYEVTSRSSDDQRAWDVFVEQPPREFDFDDNRKFELILKLLKFIVYIVAFIIVLSSAVASKVSLLLMTSLIKANHTGVAICNHGIPGLDRDKRYQMILSTNDSERIAWIWCLLIVLIIPELMTLFRSVRICTFKSYRRPAKSVFLFVSMISVSSTLYLTSIYCCGCYITLTCVSLQVLLTETSHAIGTVILVFVILPSLDVVKGAMLTNCLCIIPVLLSLLSRNSYESNKLFKIMLDFTSLMIQLSSFIIWPMSVKSNIGYLIPIVSVLISLTWWENYVSKHSTFTVIRALSTMKDDLHRSRYFTYIFISSWKIFVIFVSMLCTRYTVDGSVSHLFVQFKSSLSHHKISIVRDASDYGAYTVNDNNIGIESETIEMDANASVPLLILLVQIVSTWLCYVVGKFACKIMIQSFSFALPLNLTVPITVSFLIASCGIHYDNVCYLKDYLPRYVFWSCPLDTFTADGDLFNVHALMWLLWLLSQTWITLHVWIPKCERLAATEKLFVNPMYSSALIDQSMAMNRRRDDEEMIKSEDINLESESGINSTDPSQHYETISEHAEETKKLNSSDQITKIYACATMWHETTEEMVQMLKSVIRMDEDQCARRNAQKYLRIVDPDYYEFEGKTLLPSLSLTARLSIVDEK